MRRVGDGFEPISWATAYAEIGQRMRDLRRRHGKDAVGGYYGNPTAHSSAVLAAEIAEEGPRQPQHLLRRVDRPVPAVS